MGSHSSAGGQAGEGAAGVVGVDRRAPFGAEDQVGQDLVGRLHRPQPVQPAIVVVEVAGLVHWHQHGEVVDLRQLEVLGPGARDDVDDPSPLIERGVVPCDDPMVVAGCGKMIERPHVREADQFRSERRLHPALVRGYRARATQIPSSRKMYSASGFTAAATFAGRVHGVVVQMTSSSPGRSRSGKRT